MFGIDWDLLYQLLCILKKFMDLEKEVDEEIAKNDLLKAEVRLIS